MSYADDGLGETIAYGGSRRIVRRNVLTHSLNTLRARPAATRVVVAGGLGDDGLGVAPAAIVGIAQPVSQLLNKLGPSHTAKAIAQNKGKFDDLGIQAVSNPSALATGVTNSGARVPTSRTALAWLDAIVNGPGFQGGAGTPFPDNPRDYLVWGPNPTDPNRRDELTYAKQVRDGVLATLASPTPAPSTGAPTPPGSTAPALILAQPAVIQAAPPITTTGPSAGPAPSAPPPSVPSLFQPRPVSPRIAPPPAAPTAPSDTTLDTLTRLLTAVAQPAAPAPSSQPVNVTFAPPAAAPAASSGGVGDFLTNNKGLVYGGLALVGAALILPRLMPRRNRPRRRGRRR